MPAPLRAMYVGESNTSSGPCIAISRTASPGSFSNRAFTRLAASRSAAPLIGMLMFGNLLRESGVVERLSNAAQNEIINIVTIFLGLSVGSRLSADKFLSVETLGILALGALAFAIGTAAGVLMGKAMHRISGGKINPLIGAAGVSAVPMAARVVNKVGLKANPHNFLLMHAMGANTAGQLGSVMAGGIVLALLATFL